MPLLSLPAPRPLKDILEEMRLRREKNLALKAALEALTAQGGRNG